MTTVREALLQAGTSYNLGGLMNFNYCTFPERNVIRKAKFESSVYYNANLVVGDKMFGHNVLKFASNAKRREREAQFLRDVEESLVTPKLIGELEDGLILSYVEGKNGRKIMAAGTRTEKEYLIMGAAASMSSIHKYSRALGDAHIKNCLKQKLGVKWLDFDLVVDEKDLVTAQATDILKFFYSVVKVLPYEQLEEQVNSFARMWPVYYGTGCFNHLYKKKVLGKVEDMLFSETESLIMNHLYPERTKLLNNAISQEFAKHI
ncbi:MAG: hypothetical protein ABIF40_00160 [archaeon]